MKVDSMHELLPAGETMQLLTSSRQEFELIQVQSALSQLYWTDYEQR